MTQISICHCSPQAVNTLVSLSLHPFEAPNRTRTSSSRPLCPHDLFGAGGGGNVGCFGTCVVPEIALGGLAFAFVGGGGAGGGAKRLGGGGGGTFVLIGELGTCWLEEEDPLARCVLLSSSCNKGNSCSINHDADLAAVINVFLHVFATFGFVLYAYMLVLLEVSIALS